MKCISDFYNCFQPSSVKIFFLAELVCEFLELIYSVSCSLIVGVVIFFRNWRWEEEKEKERRMNIVCCCVTIFVELVNIEQLVFIHVNILQ